MAIKSKFEDKKIKVNESKISVALKQKRGTFVTLTINGKLRSCIGRTIPVQELYKDVIENALAAAFSDPRFSPLKKEEFAKIKIEISVLGKCQKLKYKSLFQLIDNLEKNKPGVILKKGSNQATFLPQVWEELPSGEQFLSQLCLKAGLQVDEWTRNPELETYSVEKIQ